VPARGAPSAGRCDRTGARYARADRAREIIGHIEQLPVGIEQALKLDGQIKALAANLQKHDNCLYLGRGINYPIALEGALKLKRSHTFTPRAIRPAR
jgi:glucosamine--fructose-6-phosphate aminotransferase (isomerizing)